MDCLLFSGQSHIWKTALDCGNVARQHNEPCNAVWHTPYYPTEEPVLSEHKESQLSSACSDGICIMSSEEK